ncbi:hypothetical protein M4L90_14705 [Staphylococcus equorum]|uniref:Uncharacterized protein n=1 Tax=Staphylococcus equorum TaxID=246432 RepID=A0A9X4R0B5_9STAP|nr:hypothetical protein [Staphylococcus equorum]MDG0821126.1 hypothetical protein [Staphylococcus equorum]MDG0841780.1 hypothetical protein [Staphylococcus equorum]MDG0847498.1 hypothetical protein [Staphylococcus equorum]
MGLKFDDEKTSLEHNKKLAKAIQNNIRYLHRKFPNLKNTDFPRVHGDVGYLQFVASYFASENINLDEDYLIVSNIEDNNKFYVFLDKNLYIFSFENNVRVRVFSFWQKISHTLNYQSLQDGSYFIQNRSYNFLDSDFRDVHESVFENAENPQISSVTVELNFCILNISVSNSNFKSIDSILSYFKK